MKIVNEKSSENLETENDRSNVGYVNDQEDNM